MASCLGVRERFIRRRNARMSVARPMDMGIDPGVLAAEVAKFLSAEEERKNQARRRPVDGEEDQASMTRKRNARMNVARPMDMGIEPGVLAAEPEVAKFLSAEEERKNQARRRPVDGEEDQASMTRKRNARMSVARPMDMGMEPGVLAAEVAKFLSAEEERKNQARRPVDGKEDGARTMRKRNARIRVATPVDHDMVAADVAEFVAAAKRQQTCQSENGRLVRRARISVAGPVNLGIDPVWLAAEVAKSQVAAERRQATLEAKRAARHARHADEAGPGRLRGRVKDVVGS